MAVDLIANQTYTIDLEGAPSGRGTLSDPLLSIHAANGLEIDGNDDFGGSLNSRIVLTAFETARYFVNVQSFGAATGSYTLTVSPPGGTGTVATVK